jgi:hypothetical protein
VTWVRLTSTVRPLGGRERDLCCASEGIVGITDDLGRSRKDGEMRGFPQIGNDRKAARCNVTKVKDVEEFRDRTANGIRVRSDDLKERKSVMDLHYCIKLPFVG